MTRVRDAVAADLPAVLAIYNDVLTSSTAIWRDEPETLDERLAWFEAKSAGGWPVVVADDGDVAGFASFGPFRAWPGYDVTVEHTIHVAAGRRGRGVGGALMGELVARARAMGKTVMIAGVDGANEGSMRFHARLGFREVGRLPAVGRKRGAPVDLVLLQLDL